MEKEGYSRAYFRELNYSDQCELHFFLNTEVPGIGWINEEIKAVRQMSDTVGSLLQHIKNKIQKIFLDKKMENLELKENENNEENNIKNNVTSDISVSLKRENKPIKSAMVLKNFPTSLRERGNVFFEVFEQKFLVVLNAPLIKQIKLPSVLYANFTIQPTKFRAMYTDNKKSLFYWYKSTNKIHWEEIGIGFIYLLKEEDVGHYIKIVCTPFNEFQVQGLNADDISENVVERIGELPTCPFEKRHESTPTKLKGLEFRIVSYNILADRYTADRESYAYCPPQVLAIDYRKQLILKELLGYNADIICLQEVDNKHYTEYFKGKFKDIDYGSVYHRKGNRIPEGLVCIFNKTRYKLLESKHIVMSIEIRRHKVFSYIWNIINKNEELKAMFLKQSTSLQVTVLQDKERRRCIIIGNTHLFYHPDADHIRLLQANLATAYLNMIKRRYLRDGVDVSVVFCGDFNSNPEKSLLKYMIQGQISPTHEDCLKIHANGKALLYHEFVFESACGTPKYTNYTPDFKGCLDYIFIETNKLSVERTTPLMDEEELSKYEGLPNKFYPSDHLALVADIKFKARGMVL